MYDSLIETARLNGINPRGYLNWIVAQTEANRGDVDHEELLPWHCPKGHIEA